MQVVHLERLTHCCSYVPNLCVVILLYLLAPTIPIASSAQDASAASLSRQNPQAGYMSLIAESGMPERAEED